MLQHPQRQIGQLVEQLPAEMGIDVDGDPLHQLATALTQNEIEQDDDDHADREPLKGAQTGMKLNAAHRNYAT